MERPQMMWRKEPRNSGVWGLGTVERGTCQPEGPWMQSPCSDWDICLKHTAKGPGRAGVSLVSWQQQEARWRLGGGRWLRAFWAMAEACACNSEWGGRQWTPPENPHRMESLAGWVVASAYLDSGVEIWGRCHLHFDSYQILQWQGDHCLFRESPLASHSPNFSAPNAEALLILSGFKVESAKLRGKSAQPLLGVTTTPRHPEVQFLDFSEATNPSSCDFLETECSLRSLFFRGWSGSLFIFNPPIPLPNFSLGSSSNAVATESGKGRFYLEQTSGL